MSAKDKETQETISGIDVMRGVGVERARPFWADAWHRVVIRRGAQFGLVWIGIIGFFGIIDSTDIFNISLNIIMVMMMAAIIMMRMLMMRMRMTMTMMMTMTMAMKIMMTMLLLMIMMM